jgi:hypothetical protein
MPKLYQNPLVVDRQYLNNIPIGDKGGCICCAHTKNCPFEPDPAFCGLTSQGKE